MSQGSDVADPEVDSSDPEGAEDPKPGSPDVDGPPSLPADGCSLPAGWQWLDRYWLSFSLVVGLAFLLRLSQLLETSDTPLFLHLHADSQVYSEWAQRIVAGDWLGNSMPVFYQAPLYPYLLAILFSIFGPSTLALCAFQVVLSSLTAGLVMHLARTLFGPVTGLIAGLMAACCGMFIFYSSLVLGATLILFLDVALLALLVGALRSRKLLGFVAAGACLALSAAARGNILLFAPLAGLSIVLGLGARAWRKWLPATLALAAGFLVTIAPVPLHNWLIGDDLVLLTANAGGNFYIGNNRGSDGIYGNNPTYHGEPIGYSVSEQLITLPAIAARALGRDDLRPSEVSKFWTEQTLLEIRADSRRWRQLLSQKLIYLTNAYEVPNNRNYYFSAQFSRTLSLPLLTFGVLFPLGLIGMMVSWRRWQCASALPFFFLAHSAALLAFFVNARYRLVIVPVLIIYAAELLRWAYAQARSRRPIGLGVALIGVYVAFVLSSIAVPRWSYRGEWLNMGNAYQSLGRMDEAIDAYDRSIEISPDYYQVHLHKGDLLAELERRDEARAVFQEGLQLATQGSDSLYVRTFRERIGALATRRTPSAPGRRRP